MLIEFALFTDEGVWTSWGAWTPCVQTNVNSNTGSRSRTLSHTGTTPCTGLATSWQRKLNANSMKMLNSLAAISAAYCFDAIKISGWEIEV